MEGLIQLDQFIGPVTTQGGQEALAISKDPEHGRCVAPLRLGPAKERAAAKDATGCAKKHNPR